MFRSVIAETNRSAIRIFSVPQTNDIEAVFNNPDHDPARFAAELLCDLPPRSFGIIFTPRSGSSWLADALQETKLLGRPQEWFNPEFNPTFGSP